MDLTATTAPVSDQKTSDRLSLSRLYGQHSREDRLTNEIKSLLPLLGKTYHSFKDGKLALILHDNFLSYSASVVLSAVERVPDISERIFFYDPKIKDFRSYHDVVWDIEKNPRKFAALAFKNAHGPSQIIVTPEVLGNNSRDRGLLDCRKITMPDSPVRDLGMVVQLCAKNAFGDAVEWNDIDARRGQKQIVHTSDVVIRGIDSFQFPKPVMFMDVAAKLESVRDFIRIPAHNYDRTI